MEAHVIEENIVGVAYKDLIDYAVRTSDALMLAYRTRGGKLTDKQKEVRSHLANYRVKTRHNLMWPGTICGGVEEGIFDKDSYIDVYRTSEDLLPFLYEVGGIFNWVRPYPEDLCFFRKGVCWLTNTAHEKMADILCQTEDDKVILSSIGARYERVLDCEPKLFFEEYTLD